MRIENKKKIGSLLCRIYFSCLGCFRFGKWRMSGWRWGKKKIILGGQAGGNKKRRECDFFLFCQAFVQKLLFSSDLFPEKKSIRDFFLLPKCPPIATILRLILPFTFFYSPLLGRGKKMKKKSIFSFFSLFFYKKELWWGGSRREGWKWKIKS